jgi:multidrug efflux system membrane fusion protein
MHKRFGRSILDVIPVKALTQPTQIFLLAALLALAGCSSSPTADSDGGGGGGGKGKGKKGGGGAAAAVPVLVATTKQQNVPIEVSAVGTVEAYTTIASRAW